MAKRKSPRVSAKRKKQAVRKASKPKAGARPAQKPSKGKWVYGFGDGRAEGKASMRNLLGGKGAGLAEMANLGLPVPPGFTITTELCTYYYAHDQQYPKDLRQRFLDLGAQVFRILLVVRVIVGAELGGDGEAGRHRQAEIGHFGQAGALAAQQIAHGSLALGAAVAEAVDPFSFGRFLRRARSRLGLGSLPHSLFFAFCADARGFSFSHGSKIGGRTDGP